LQGIPPRLRTHQAKNKFGTLAHLIVAIKKRNANVPISAEDTNFEGMALFAKRCCETVIFHSSASTLIQYYRANQITLNQDSVSAYCEKLGEGQTFKVQRVYDKEMTVMNKAMNYYTLDFKKSFKPNQNATGVDIETYLDYYHGNRPRNVEPCDRPVVTSVSAAQTIVSWESTVNSNWSPLFYVMLFRFMSLLRVGVIINIRKSPKELLASFRQFERFRRLLYYLQFDFEKFDKSQQLAVAIVEWFLMYNVGMSRDQMEKWINSHLATDAHSKPLGVKIRLMFQRHSGDSATALLNTIVVFFKVSVAIICMLVEMRNRENEDVWDMHALTDAQWYWLSGRAREVLVYMAALGDDSHIAMSEEMPESNMSELLASLFNSSVKFSQTHYPIFCSFLLLKAGDELFMVPDILKYIVKLGKGYAKDEQMLLEWYQSFSDACEGMDSMKVLRAAAIHLKKNYRFRDPGVILPACIAFNSVAVDFATYRSLFAKNVRKVEM